MREIETTINYRAYLNDNYEVGIMALWFGIGNNYCKINSHEIQYDLKYIKECIYENLKDEFFKSEVETCVVYEGEFEYCLEDCEYEIDSYYKGCPQTRLQPEEHPECEFSIYWNSMELPFFVFDHMYKDIEEYIIEEKIENDYQEMCEAKYGGEF